MEDNTQKKFLIINLILIFIAMVLELFAAGSSTNFGLAASLVLIFALASAAVYYFYGCKKNAATYYRITVYVFAIPYLVMIAASATSGHAAMAVLAAIAFGAICVLAEAKDYGYIKSLILGLLVLIISIVLLVVEITTIKLPFGSMLSFISEVIISLILLLMIIAKYADKHSRGSK